MEIIQLLAILNNHACKQEIIDVYKILSSVDVDSYCDEEDSDETKEDDGVDQNRQPTCLHVTKLHHP